MFKFELKNTAILQAVHWCNFPLFKFAKHFKKIFLVIFFLLLAVFIYGFFLADFATPTLSLIFGYSVISISLSAIFWELELFLNLKLKKPAPAFTFREAIDNPDETNLAAFLGFEPAMAANNAIKFARSRRLSKDNFSCS